MCGTKEILLKSWKKPHNLSPILAPAPGTPGNPGKTSQFADHHRDPENPGKNLTICGPSPGPRKFWKKHHNLRPILAPAPGTPEILEKTSQSADHPRDPGNPGKNLTILRICCWLVGCADKLCRGTLRGQKILYFFRWSVRTATSPCLDLCCCLALQGGTRLWSTQVDLPEGV